MGDAFMDIDEALAVYKETGYDPFGYFDKKSKDYVKWTYDEETKHMMYKPISRDNI